MEMMATFHMPMFRRQIRLCLLISAIFSTLAYVCAINRYPQELGTFCLIPVVLMFNLAPLGLASTDDRMFTAMLPVKAIEHWLVLIIHFMVVVPLVLLLPLFLIDLVSGFFNQDVNLITEYILSKKYFAGHYHYAYLFNQILPAAICLLCILFFRSSRILKTLLTMGGALIVSMFVGGITGGILTYRLIQTHQLVYTEANHEQFVQEIISEFSGILEGWNIFSMILSIVILYLSYRTISRYQA